jgi:Ca-activated chloride channel family protein
MLGNIGFRQSYYLLLMLLLIPWIVGVFWLINRRHRDYLRLLGATVASRASYLRRYDRFNFWLISMIAMLLVVALARPQWGTVQDVPVAGADVIIAVDVSLSMLAEDVVPSRLGQAKLIAQDLITKLPAERIGLLAFAGANVGVMPLTTDRIALGMFIESLDGRAVDRPGTALRPAIDRATRILEQQNKPSAALVIISDGEDLSEEGPEAVTAAARDAATAGVTILAVGVGTTTGGDIPLSNLGQDGFKQDTTGRRVRTQLVETTLQQIAESTGGSYVVARPEALPTSQFSTVVQQMARGQAPTRSRAYRAERFTYFLIVALLLLLGTIVHSYRR